MYVLKISTKNDNICSIAFIFLSFLSWNFYQNCLGEPIVGLHIRRTDKIGIEANSYELDEYMAWANLWFDAHETQQFLTGKNWKEAKENQKLRPADSNRSQTSMSSRKRRVFITTDDLKVIEEAQQKYSKIISLI